MANIIAINGFGISSSNAGGGASDFPYTGSAIISGSLIVTGSTTSTLGFTGSLFGTSSWADNVVSASFSSTSSRLNAANTSIFAASSNRMVITASNGIIMNAGNVGVSLESGITITGDVLPGPPITNNTSSWSLGSPTAAWKDLYVSNGSIKFISGSVSASIQFDNGNITFPGSTVTIPTGSTIPTASFALTASTLLGSVTSASYAATASYINNGVSFAGSGSIITGSIAISSSYGLLVPANTFTVGDQVKVQGVFLKPNGATATNFLIYINTANQLSGATQVAIFNTTTIRWAPITRTLSINSPTRTQTYAAATTHYNDDIAIATGFTVSNLNIDWTVDQYFLFAASNATVADRTDTLRFYAKKI